MSYNSAFSPLSVRPTQNAQNITGTFDGQKVSLTKKFSPQQTKGTMKQRNVSVDKSQLNRSLALGLGPLLGFDQYGGGPFDSGPSTTKAEDGKLNKLPPPRQLKPLGYDQSTETRNNINAPQSQLTDRSLLSQKRIQTLKDQSPSNYIHRSIDQSVETDEAFNLVRGSIKHSNYNKMHLTKNIAAYQSVDHKILPKE